MDSSYLNKGSLEKKETNRCVFKKMVVKTFLDLVIVRFVLGLRRSKFSHHFNKVE